MRRRLRSASGQAAIDYVGILAVAAALVAILILTAPSWGQSLACKVQNTINAIGVPVGTCGGSGDNANGPPGLDKCILSDSSNKGSASITIFSVKGGGQFQVLRQKRGDGKYTVTVSGGGELGAEFGIGGGVDAEGGDWQVGGKAELKGGANVQGEAGNTYIFDSEGEADDFVDIVRNKARDGAIEGAAGPAGGLLHWGLDKVGLTEDRPIPKANQQYVQGGVGLSVKGSIGPAEASASGAEILGTRKDNDTGTTTTYYRIEGKGQAGAGGLVGINGDASIQIGITRDKDGNATTATLVRKYGYAGQAPPLSLKNAKPEDYLKGLSLTASDSDGHRVEITQNLDLTDPANQAAFQAFANNPITGFGDIATAFNDRSSGNIRRYSTSESKYGGGVSGALGLKFGIDGSWEGKDSQLEGAEYWNAGGPVQEWAQCK